MLELRPNCEHCDVDLGPGSLDARICTFECTFCRACATGVFGNVCPNCAGELLTRPTRPASMGAPSSDRVLNDHDLAAHRVCRDQRPVGGDHPTVVLQRYAQAWAEGDLDRLVGCYGDDFTLHYSGTSRFSGDHVGRDAALAVMADVSAIAPRRLVSVDDVLASDTGGALIVTEELQRDGERAEVPRVLRYRVEGGLLRECWLHETDQSLVDHFWR